MGLNRTTLHLQRLLPGAFAFEYPEVERKFASSVSRLRFQSRG